MIKGRWQSGITTGSDSPAQTWTGALRAALLIMGVSGIVAQIILLRELLVSFLGNELVLGIILANWLILEAAGSFLIGKTAEAARRKHELFVVFQLLFSIFLPLAIYLSRVFKTMILLSPGEAVGFASILASSFIILLPVAVPHGALFTYGSKIYSLSTKRNRATDASSVGWVYVLETIGSIVGGLLLTFFLIGRFDSLAIVFAVSLTNAIISMILLWPKSLPRFRPVSSGLWGGSLLLTAVFSLLLFSPLVERIHIHSIKTQWSGLNLVHTENSIYGNITVAEREGQATFYTDGIPSITTPVPDIAASEDFVHFAMLLHPRPESVLILSGGAGGMIHEVLKHPVKQVEYVELDPLLLKLIERYGSGPTRQELSDSRVQIHYTDGRFFLKRSSGNYDVVFVGLGSPQELQTNRLFSREFFSTAKEKMKQDGILVLSLPGSLTYLGEELQKLNRCIRDTLQSVFAYVRIIPGDVNLYFASASESLMRVRVEELVQRFNERRIDTNLFTGAYIKHRLEEQWLHGYEQAMGRTESGINSDFHPVAVFYSLSHWNALFSPYLVRIFKSIEGAHMSAILGVVAAVTVLLAVVFLLRPERFRIPVPYAIGTTGFCGMVFDLAIIFTFQSLFGYLYYQIGLLVTVFMVGVAASSFAITHRLDRIANHATVFLLTEFCLVCFSLLLPFVFLIPSRSLEKQSVYVLLYALFLMMSLVSGMLTGAQFPLATKIHLGDISTSGSNRNRGQVAHTAGLLYGADLFGGYFGGLIGGVALLPILGLKSSCFILALIKGGSFFLILLYTVRRRTNSADSAFSESR